MEQYPHINAAVARIAKREPTTNRRLWNAFGKKPDPYMAWKDERSLLTQETKKKKGVIKTSDLGTKKKEAWNEVSEERANEAKRLTVLNWTKGIINARKNN